MKSTLKRLIAAILAFSSIAWVAPTHAQTRNIFLIGGTPNPMGTETFATILYRRTAAQLTSVRELTSASEGSQFIHLNDEARTLVVAPRTDSYPRRLEIVDMDSPRSAISIPTKNFPNVRGTSKQLSLLSSFFVKKPDGPFLYVIAGRGDGPIQYQGVNLRVASPVFQVVPSEDLKYIRVAGYGLAGSSDAAFAHLDPTLGTVFMPTGGIPVDLTIPPIPAPLLPKADSLLVGLVARNSTITAISLGGNGTGARLLVLDNLSQAWHELKFKSAASFHTKANGPWLCVTITKDRSKRPVDGGHSYEYGPQSDEERTAALAQVTHIKTGREDQYTVRNGMRDVFVGAIEIYNVQTQNRYRLETGDPDTEVLLADSDAIYYRVADKLFRGRVLGAELGPPEVLITAPELLDVHWAFWSN